MSQAKVDKYKQEKANRKKEVAKQRRNRKIKYVAGVLVGILFLVWIGYSVFKEIETAKQDESKSIAASIAYEEWLEEYSKHLATSTAKENTSSKEDASTTKAGETTTGKSEDTSSSEETTSAKETSEETTSAQ